MSSHHLRARRAVGPAGTARVVRDPDLVAPHLADAAHVPGGHALEVWFPTSEADVVEILRGASRLLTIGAQSSLTGGATPFGDVLLSTARLDRIAALSETSVRVGSGVTITALDDHLARRDRAYPPAPTFAGATVGGIVATNAAGAATYKYGATRAWVEELTVVLADGDVLDIVRGATRAHADGYFDLDLARGTVRVPVPRYQMPEVAKLSAGYHAAPGLDLIDLFIGSEGTLGVVTEVTLRVLPHRPASCLALVSFAARDRALAFLRRLRSVSEATRAASDPRGVDMAAIEHMDARCLALLREGAVDRHCRVALPANAAIALLVSLELPPGTGPSQAFDALGDPLGGDTPDGPLRRFGAMLTQAGGIGDIEVAVPGDLQRAGQLLTLRESVPAAVNQIVGRLQQTVDPHIQKTAADVVVPIGRLEEMLDVCDLEARRRGLDLAVWGHISDGNLHPNIMPRSPAELASGKEAVLAIGRAAIRLGGAPMAEHGVGRNPIKQQLLREMYGEGGITDMRRVKLALDPAGKLAPGVLFQPA